MSSEKEIKQLFVGLSLDAVAHVFSRFDDGVKAGIKHVLVYGEFFVYRVFQLSARLV
jgi:hypothetical protein